MLNQSDVLAIHRLIKIASLPFVRKLAVYDHGDWFVSWAADSPDRYGNVWLKTGDKLPSGQISKVSLLTVSALSGNDQRAFFAAAIAAGAVEVMPGYLDISGM